MDPTANLREQMEIARNMLRDDSEEIDTGDAVRLAELVVALDQWIIKGGSLPNQWRQS